MNSIKRLGRKIGVLLTAVMLMLPSCLTMPVFASVINGVLVADVYDSVSDGTTLLPDWGVDTSNDGNSGVSVENGVLKLSNEEYTDYIQMNTRTVNNDGSRPNNPSLTTLNALIEFNVRKDSYATAYFEQRAQNGSPMYRISFEADGVVRVHNCRTPTGGRDGNYASAKNAYEPNRFCNIKIQTCPDTAKFSVYVNDVPIVEGATHTSPSVKNTRFVRFAIDARGEDTSKIVNFEIADFFIRDLTKSTALDDGRAVSAAEELLTYSTLLNENRSKQAILTDLTLPNGLAVLNPLPVNGTVTKDVAIEWESSNPSVIDPATGKVTRPKDEEPDAVVTLTATITKGAAESAQKMFTLTVPRIINPPFEVAAALPIVGSIGKETTHIELPVTDPAGVYEASITWQSDCPEVIAPDGTVVAAQEEKLVTLTATIVVEGYAPLIKEFKIQVIPDIGETNLLLEGSAETNGLVVYNLPANAIDGDVTTFWKSSLESGSTLTITLDETKAVNRLILRELTAGVKSFRIEALVNGMWTPVYNGARSETGAAIISIDTVQAAGLRLVVSEADGEVGLAELEAYGTAELGQEAKKDAAALTLGDISDVTADFALPVTGALDSVITWTSSKPEVIAVEGGVAKVTRPQASTADKITVMLTATVSKDGYSETKQFAVKVTPIVTASPSPQPPSSNRGSGGGGSGGKGVAIPAFPQPPILPEQQPPEENRENNQPSGLPFADVESGSWEYPYIKKLYDKKMISGVSAQAFEPDRSMTKEEFVTIVVNVLGLARAAAETPFEDVSAEAWYAPYVAAARSNGIVAGNSDTVFGTGSRVTRQEMAAIIHRAAVQSGMSLNGTDNGLPFADAGEISDWAKEAVQVLRAAGIIDGIEGSFLPEATATRAQAAKMVCALLQ